VRHANRFGSVLMVLVVAGCSFDLDALVGGSLLDADGGMVGDGGDGGSDRDHLDADLTRDADTALQDGSVVLDDASTDADARTMDAGSRKSVQVSELDGEGFEQDPTLTGDRLEVFFTRTAAGSLGNIYTAKRASVDVPFGEPSLVSVLNTDASEVSPEVSRDGLKIWFIRGTAAYFSTRTSRIAGWSVPAQLDFGDPNLKVYHATPSPELNYLVLDIRDVPAAPRLYTASATNQPTVWMSPKPLLVTDLGNPATAAGAMVDESGRLWFASDSGGGYELYYATALSFGKYAAPVLVPGIDTSGAEADPWISPDGHELWFSLGFASDPHSLWSIQLE
jgi:hypothetical protein